MNPKTIARLGMKLLAGFLVIRILTDVLAMPIALLIQALATATQPAIDYRTFIVSFVIHPLVPIGASIYLVFGGRRLVGWIARDNRSRCSECDYLLTGLSEPRCPECGTPFAISESPLDPYARIMVPKRSVRALVRLFGLAVLILAAGGLFFWGGYLAIYLVHSGSLRAGYVVHGLVPNSIGLLLGCYLLLGGRRLAGKIMSGGRSLDSEDVPASAEPTPRHGRSSWNEKHEPIVRTLVTLVGLCILLFSVRYVIVYGDLVVRHVRETPRFARSGFPFPKHGLAGLLMLTVGAYLVFAGEWFIRRVITGAERDRSGNGKGPPGQSDGPTPEDQATAVNTAPVPASSDSHLEYKALLRAIVMLLGAYFLVMALSRGVITAAFLLDTQNLAEFGRTVSGHLGGLLYMLPYACAGAYLFFRPERLADRIMPGNHLCCPHCGYDLRVLTGSRCPECGGTVAVDGTMPTEWLPVTIHKTMARAVLMLLGIYFVVIAAANLMLNCHWLAYLMLTVGRVPLHVGIIRFLGGLLKLGVGAYLLVGSRWLINRIMPAGRSYCRGCGYELSDPTGGSCPECDTVVARICGEALGRDTANE